MLVGAAAFVIAVGVALYVVRPFHTGTLGYDAAASILYFDRLMAGRHLEAFLGATPKPLLTVTYGLVHSVAPDWRAISWLAILAYGTGIATSAVLAHRLGGIIAAGFVTAALIGSAELLQDVDLAYAVSWALIFWSAAGLLVTSARPRYAWAGVALALAGLARFETLIVTGSAALILGLGFVAARSQTRDAHWVRARVPILLGFLTLPVQGVHDWLLTGDPLYSESVPVLSSAGLHLPGVAGVLGAIGAHYAAEPILLLLALLGMLTLWGRSPDVAAGVIALVVGVLLFLVYLASRGIYVSDRYIAPVDVGLTFAASLGVASIRFRSLARRVRAIRLRAAAPILAAAGGAVIAVAVIRPFGPLDRPTRSDVTFNGIFHRDLERLTPVILESLGGRSGLPSFPDDGTATTHTGSRAILLAPVLAVPQLSLDLDLPLSAITGTQGPLVTTDGRYPQPGQLLLHYIGRDDPESAFRLFEVRSPTTRGAIAIDPVEVDPAGRFWLVRIR